MASFRVAEPWYPNFMVGDVICWVYVIMDWVVCYTFRYEEHLGGNVPGTWRWRGRIGDGALDSWVPTSTLAWFHICGSVTHDMICIWYVMLKVFTWYGMHIICKSAYFHYNLGGLMTTLAILSRLNPKLILIYRLGIWTTFSLSCTHYEV